MKIVVPVKRVPDPYRRVRLTPDGSIDVDAVQWVVNPLDELALDEAVRLRREAGEVVAISVGPSVWQEQLRAALARGADRAILVLHDGPTDSRLVSHLLAAVIRREQPDLILMGRTTPDDDSGETGPRLAARLGWPQATFASRIELTPDGRSARVTRVTDAGHETVEVTLPAGVTVDLSLGEPRLIPLAAIIKARSKTLAQIAAAEFGPCPAPGVTLLSLESPPPRPAGRRVADVDELLAALRDEARVIAQG